jgi:hypothetical protein
MVADRSLVIPVTVRAMSQPRPAAVGRASGNIGAMKLLMPLWFFRSSGAHQKKIPTATPAGEGYCPFAGGHSAVAPFPLC